jgi:Mrp family chromosome partitioning ATPase
MVCGPIPPNPAELILMDRCKELFERLKAEFDYIVVDSPPVGLVTDAFLLMQHVDQCLLVSRFAVSEKAHVSMLQELYENKKLVRPGILLNGVKSKGEYGYGYGYGYGYYEDDKKIKKNIIF